MAILPALRRRPVTAVLRPARVEDIPALVVLEERCFAHDRLSRRSFQHLLTRGRAACLVAEEGGRLMGYTLVLFRQSMPLGRLYSLAVDPDAQGQGIGRRLLDAAEEEARQRACVAMRLEVHPANAGAIELYRSSGYREFGILPDYYEDHAAARRYEKRLITGPAAPDQSRVPYYAQTLEFTCGPAALMMAMAALDPDLRMDRRLELRLWRESTTVYMAGGHGGCGPYGLALAAWRRGFAVTVHVSGDTDLFLDTVRKGDKKEVMRLVEEDFLDEIRGTDIVVRRDSLNIDELAAAFQGGAIPVVLISSYRLDRGKTPHWVVPTAFDERFVYVHEPFVDVDEGRTTVDCISIPVPRNEFARMARYGRAQLRACVVVARREVG